MAELDRFEARLAASLERLANEVPTEVDATELARTVAASEARRGWFGLLSDARGRRLVPALQVALVLVALLALLLGFIALSPRLPRTPFESTIHGSMACAGNPWTTSSGGAIDLHCATGLADPRLAGPVTISLMAPTSMGGVAVREGTVVIDATNATWSGVVQLLAGGNGVAAGYAVLEGRGAGGGTTLRVRLMSDDGVAWGLLGWVETR